MEGKANFERGQRKLESGNWMWILVYVFWLGALLGQVSSYAAWLVGWLAETGLLTGWLLGLTVLFGKHIKRLDNLYRWSGRATTTSFPTVELWFFSLLLASPLLIQQSPKRSILGLLSSKAGQRSNMMCWQSSNPFLGISLSAEFPFNTSTSALKSSSPKSYV